MGHKVDMIGTFTKTPIQVETLFGKVSGGIGSFGLPAASANSRVLDKIKLAVIYKTLRRWKNITDQDRSSLTFYGWTQHGTIYLPNILHRPFV